MVTKRLTKTRECILGIAACASVFSAVLLLAYNPFQDLTAAGPAAARWPGATMTWHLSTKVTNPSNVDSSITQIGSAIDAAFSAWKGTSATLNGQMISSLIVTRGTDTQLTDPDVNSADGINIVSFSPSSSISFPTGAIAFTAVTTSVSGSSSNMFDADIAFNPAQLFTTQGAAGRFDVQSVATHEAGHSLGLDHSGMAHAVMFPFGDTTATGQRRGLSIDDILGIASLYPAASFASATGTLSGQIALTVAATRTGAFASHVIVIDAGSGAAVVDGLTNTDGTYSRAVPPGTYNILALPLAPDVNSGLYILDDFSGWACGYSENSAPCCVPGTSGCTGRLVNPTNYTGKFF